MPTHYQGTEEEKLALDAFTTAPHVRTAELPSPLSAQPEIAWMLNPFEPWSWAHSLAPKRRSASAQSANAKTGRLNKNKWNEIIL